VKKKDRIIFLVVAMIPALTLFVTFYLIPIGSLLYTSFFKWDSIKMEEFIGFANYIQMFHDPVFWQALRNNISWSLIAAFIHIPMALLIALILNGKPKGWKNFRTIYFLPHVISITAFAVIYISVFNPSFGLLNAVLRVLGMNKYSNINWLFHPYWAWKVIISTWIFHIGLFAMIFLAEITSIPTELYEAAKIDGASPIKQDLCITIPLLKNIIGVCIILDVTGGLRYFEGLYIMTNGAPNWKTETLALLIYQQLRLIHNSYANTVGVALLVLGLLVVLLFSRLFRLGKSEEVVE